MERAPPSEPGSRYPHPADERRNGGVEERRNGGVEERRNGDDGGGARRNGHPQSCNLEQGWK